MTRKYPITRTDGYRLTISGLITKRAELAGEKNAALKRVHELGEQIVHVDATLRLFGFTDFQGIQPIKRAPKDRATKAEALARHKSIRELLSANPDGVTTPEIAEHLQCHFPDADKRRIRNYARKVLNRWQAAGTVEVCDYTGQAKRWRLR
ncbi:MAG: hypothetical protein JJ926_12005 [Roseitalea sp.]|nr:hypothetical protein [Roseitalea sp.]MBO6952599.1 hypothetical protein [Rhizobiaceae bacterium]MBO6592914.1 hypothetical protein [Roseitalea sp.]MBO6600343.1 hypothetical protein [Roseitalea sp.]MBO6613245.1 hypothetical protein [Roseitalea sp.]